jgi:hypothetical protein
MWMWMVMTMALVCENKTWLMSLAKNAIGMWDNLVLVMGPSLAMWFTCR